MNVNRVQFILEQIEQINSEIKRRTSSLERLKRSNSSLRNKERNSIALLNVTRNVSNRLSDATDEDVSSFENLIGERSSFCRFNGKLLNGKNETAELHDLATSDKRVNYLPDRQSANQSANNALNDASNKLNSLRNSSGESEINQPNCSRIKSENSNFLRLQKLTEKLAETNSSTIASFDSLHAAHLIGQSHHQFPNQQISSPSKSHSTKLGISSLKTEANGPTKMCDNTVGQPAKRLESGDDANLKVPEATEGILEETLELSDIESALRDIDSELREASEANESSRPEMQEDRQDSPNGGEQSHLCDKPADRNGRLLKTRKLLKGEIKDKNNNLQRFKSLPQLNLRAKIEKNIDKLSSVTCLSNFGYDFSTPSTPTKNCFSLPRSFCLNSRKKAIASQKAVDNRRVTSESPTGHKLGSFNASRANRIKSFFKTKLTSLNSGSPNNSSLNQLAAGDRSDSPALGQPTASKRLHRQASFSDSEFNADGVLDADCNANICNSSEKVSKDAAHKMCNSNQLRERSNKPPDKASDHNNLANKGTNNMSAPKRQFGKKISKRLNKQDDSHPVSGATSESPNFVKNDRTVSDYLDNSIENSCDHLFHSFGQTADEPTSPLNAHLSADINTHLNSHLNSHLNNHLDAHLHNQQQLNGELANDSQSGADREQKANQALNLNAKASNKTVRNKFPAFLNGGYRISRNSCQSSFSSADSGHTSVPSTSSFSSSNLARSLSFNETPTPDLIYTRMSKLKSEETNGSLSSSTTNTDSLVVHYTKPSLLIDESFCQHDAELNKMLDKSKVGSFEFVQHCFRTFASLIFLL